MTTERSPSTKRTRLSASCLVGAVRLPTEAVRRMTYVLPWWITHWSARSSVDCAGRSPSALWTRRCRCSGWPSGSSSWGCLVRLRCASAGCLLLRRSLSASSALSSSFVTILSLISSHSPGLSTEKVRKTWRSPQVCSLRSSSRSAWSYMLTMVIGRLPLTFGASSRCLKYCSIHSRAGRSLSWRSAFPRKSNLLTMISFRGLIAPDVSYSLQLLMRSGQRIFSKQQTWRLWAAYSFCKPASVSTVASML